MMISARSCAMVSSDFASRIEVILLEDELHCEVVAAVELEAV